MGADECVESMYELVETIRDLHQTELIISLPPPSQRVPYNKKINEANDILLGDSSLRTIDQRDSFIYNGRIDKSLYKDPSHPNSKGLSRIITNIKKEVNKAVSAY